MDLPQIPRKSFFESIKQSEKKIPEDFMQYITASVQAPDIYLAGPNLIKFHTAHRFHGYSTTVDGVPVLYCAQTAGKFRPKGDQLRFLTWGWTDHFGSAFTVTVLQVGEKRPFIGRVFIDKEDPVLAQLASGSEFILVMHEGKRLSGVYRVDYSHPSASAGVKSQIEEVLDFSSLTIDDSRLVYWSTMEMDTFTKSFNRRDLLCKGWQKTFVKTCSSDEERHYKRAREIIAADGSVIRTTYDNAPPLLKDFFDCIIGANFKLNTIFRHLDALVDQEMSLGDLFHYLSVYGIHYKDEDTDFLEFFDAVTMCLMLYTISPSATACGTRISSINGLTGKLEYMKIGVEEYPADVHAANFWFIYGTCYVSQGMFNTTLLVKSGEVPAGIKEIADGTAKIRINGDLSAIKECTSDLLTEAKTSKKWTIPWGATVEINFGPFVYAQFFEFPADIYIVLRTADWRYALGLIASSLDGCNNVHLYTEDGFPDETMTEALLMVLAAVIRDFHVVEEREKVFKAESPAVLKKRHLMKEVSIVYLPRVKYSYTYNIEKVVQDLDYKERRAHFVAAHLRVARQASDRQKSLASRYGFDVPDGYTFIKPHERGHLKREVIYRSRSALQSIYEAEVYSGDGIIPDWFKFETDVAALMKNMKYEVEHVSRGRNGDSGIDVYAFRTDSSGDENWIIQCKCYSKQKVGPSEIRELLGTLAAQKAPAKGMLVTTSEFTEGARELARNMGVSTIDGKEFLAMLDKHVPW